MQPGHCFPEDTLDTTATSCIRVSLYAHAKTNWSLNTERACALHVSVCLASVRACVLESDSGLTYGVRRANIWSVTAWTGVGEPWHLFALINWVDPSAEIYILIAVLLILKTNGLSLWAFIFSAMHTFFNCFFLSSLSFNPICGSCLI